jgi:hypothetical protein
MIEFFDIEENDASKVIWAHGVNSQLKLKKALVDETMVLEADIIYIENKHPDGPVMAHPPQQGSLFSHLLTYLSLFKLYFNRFNLTRQ